MAPNNEEDVAVIEVGSDDLSETSAPLEQKYRNQMRQIVSQKIELPISTLEQMIEKQIDLSPDFQRRGIWDRDRQSRFIESIIMNVPIPPVFLGEDEYGKYVVLDGRQRLTAINDFLKNGYALKGLSVWEDLNGLNFLGLEQRKLATAVTRRFIPAVVLLRESSPQVKYDVFDRLNTGGVKAEPMEIRNAIYRGPFTALLHQLAASARFRQLWNIPISDIERNDNATYRRMDDLEIILRFFALTSPSEMNLNFRDYLGEYMELRNKAYATTPSLEAEDRSRFVSAMENTWHIFGENAFRRPLKDGSFAPAKSAPLADAITIALSTPNFSDLTPIRVEMIRQRLKTLCTEDPEFQKAIGTGTNGKKAISTRIDYFKESVTNALSA